MRVRVVPNRYVDSVRLMKMEDDLHKAVVSQHEAIVARYARQALRRGECVLTGKGEIALAKNSNFSACTVNSPVLVRKTNPSQPIKSPASSALENQRDPLAPGEPPRSSA